MDTQHTRLALAERVYGRALARVRRDSRPSEGFLMGYPMLPVGCLTDRLYVAASRMLARAALALARGEEV